MIENKTTFRTPAAPSNIAEETARILLDTSSVLVRPDDPFTFTSGRKRPVYEDCRRLISIPEDRNTLMEYARQILEERIEGDNIDVIAGGETAGIPYAAFLSDKMDKPMVYIRKKPKGFGAMAQIEGHFEKNTPHVVLVEDLQSEGTSKEVFVNALRTAGAEIGHIFVIFHYGIFASSVQAMEDMDVTLHCLANWWDIIALIEKENRMSKGEIDTVKAFLNNPQG